MNKTKIVTTRHIKIVSRPREGREGRSILSSVTEEPRPRERRKTQPRLSSGTSPEIVSRPKIKTLFFRKTN